MWTPSFAIIVCCSITTQYGHACVWPNFFTLPLRNSKWSDKLWERSWESLGRTKGSGLKYINEGVKSNTWIKVVGTDQMLIFNNSERRRSGRMEDEDVLSCHKDLRDGKFLVAINRTRLTVDGVVHSHTRQCIQLVRRSPFVLQWARGPESPDVTQCPDGFAELSPWPLIYLPFREAFPRKLLRYADLREQYQACPKLGGFQMRILNKDGEPWVDPNYCPNNDPSPRLELECYRGDGMRILSNNGDCSFLNKQYGWKLYCLGSWKDGDHTFSVLAPSDEYDVHSLHCLRINHVDPTSEPAILFLDSVCQSGDLTGADISFLQLELRRKVISGICDDYSDQCSQSKCDAMLNSCLKTCDSCQDVKTVAFNETMRGRWILPLKGVQKTLIISENKISAFETVSLNAYSVITNESLCYSQPREWKDEDDIFKYIVAGNGDGEGCGPRVSQVMARPISQSVLLLHMPPAAPLRANPDIQTTSSWCHNNYIDNTKFRPLFKLDTPYMEENRPDDFLSNHWNGYLTLVAENGQSSPKTCVDFNQYESNDRRRGVGLKYVSDLKITLKFSDDKGDEKECEGTTHMEGSKWTLEYTCNSSPKVDATFDCLGDYEVTSSYHAVVLRAPATVVDGSPFSLTDRYYCLLVHVRTDDVKKSPLLLNPAGNCDSTFAKAVQYNIQKPMASLDVQEVFQSNSSETSRLDVKVFAFLLFTILLRNFRKNNYC